MNRRGTEPYARWCERTEAASYLIPQYLHQIQDLVGELAHGK